MLKCNLCDRDFKNRGGLISHMNYCKRTILLKNDVIDLYKNNYSIIDISKKLKLCKSKVVEYVGDKIRSRSDANMVAHEKYPDSFKHSEESKQKMRDIRLKWMKENPEKTAWRLSNLSYPEKLFQNKIKELEWDKKYLIKREKTMFPFYIDFAFENEKVAVEIDGSQHLEENRKIKDNQKDDLLIKNGWKVIRISENEIKNNINNCIKIISETLDENFICDRVKKVGIIEEKKAYIKKERNGNRFTSDEIKGQMKQRKIERPSYEKLIEMINEKNIYQVSKTFGVSFHTIKKWIGYYEKYENKKHSPGDRGFEPLGSAT